MLPWGDPQKTCRRFQSLQLKLKRFPLLALEVSESVRSISNGLGHRISKELLQSSDLHMICLLWEGICHPFTTLLSSRNLFWVQLPSWLGVAGSFGGISCVGLCCSVVSNPTVAYILDPILSSSFFSFPHPFSAFPILFQLSSSFCSCECISWQRWLPHGVAALKARFPSHLVGTEKKYSGPSPPVCWRPPEWCWALSVAVVQADAAQPLAEGAQWLLRLVQETYVVDQSRSHLFLICAQV